jgi:hypothetical protein
VSLAAINSHLKRFVPEISPGEGWIVFAGGLGAIAVAIRFGGIWRVAEGLLVAVTGLRYAIKGMVELWIAYSWLSFFAIHFVFDAWRIDKSTLLGGSWALVFDASCAVGCAAFIRHRERTSDISKGQD